MKLNSVPRVDRKRTTINQLPPSKTDRRSYGRYDTIRILQNAIFPRRPPVQATYQLRQIRAVAFGTKNPSQNLKCAIV
jgi:hypothetical protein